MVHRKKCGCSKLFYSFSSPGKLTKILCSGRNAIFREGEVIICSCNVIEISVSQSLKKAKVSCHQHRTLLKCSQQASRLQVLSLRVGLAKIPTPTLGLYTPVFWSPIPVGHWDHWRSSAVTYSRTTLAKQSSRNSVKV